MQASGAGSSSAATDAGATSGGFDDSLCSAPPGPNGDEVTERSDGLVPEFRALLDAAGYGENAEIVYVTEETPAGIICTAITVRFDWFADRHQTCFSAGTDAEVIDAFASHVGTFPPRPTTLVSLIEMEMLVESCGAIPFDYVPCSGNVPGLPFSWSLVLTDEKVGGDCDPVGETHTAVVDLVDATVLCETNSEPYGCTSG